MKACYFTTDTSNRLDFVFADREAVIAQNLTMLDTPVRQSELDARKAEIADVEVILSTWGTPALTKEQVQTYFPKLKLLLYAAGSVKYFAQGYLDAGVTVVTANQAMADFVAQFTVAAIYHLNKGFYRAAQLYREESFLAGKDFSINHCPGNYETTVGLLGAGAIGTRVIQQLQSYPFIILVFDPFMSDARAQELGVTKASLEEIFAKSDIISNHLANNPETVGMITYAHFSKMGPHASFLNTGRGAQLVEADLARALREEPGRFALLDVTTQEPLPRDHEFWTLSNMILTPHIAGYGCREVRAYSDLLMAELRRYLNGEPLQHAVKPEALARMA
ncbi:MAG: hydroxyacid dehydrogenase [Clostridiales bacterium]|nr:hydroxyacid dehydrogenase [Clostridiales bacterium]